MANFNFNKVILGGRMTTDAELKTTPSGVTVTTFSVAVNRKVVKDQEQKTDFINCVAWRTTAEFISRYFHKGSSICVVGSLYQRSWQDKDGNKRYTVEVIVDEAYFVDSKNEATSIKDQQPNNYVPAQYTQPVPTNFEAVKGDDDLPF